MDMPPDALSTVTDDALLVLYANGDPSAARVLTTRLLPRVFAQARRMLGDDSEAEDVAQESMLRLWRIAPEWRQGEAQVTTWLYKVCANLCTDRLRKRRGVALEEVSEPADPAPTAVQRMQDRSRSDALQTALNALPDRQRQAVVLRHIEGLANPEIAAVMDISPRAVESLTARGKRALAALLAGRRAELGYEDDTP
ncbi:RNA polymerase sigma factor [Roseobacter sp. YSTF-M11]|uniref:RNA polymerase sigma factor n=1 Tax=Roseobacter insulae TaxID=2859783 RepID=A0A9X1K3B7_9RHOB|nr:RNA polymerase sigma factor [Roseobacter insulae]MBW4708462.1 RNA polymerase sigma factor [Roseobacter insulae]